MSGSQNTKGKNLLIIFLGIAISILIAYFTFTYPREFNRTYEGVQFRCGKSNADFAEKVTIHFEGKLSRNALLGHKFKGKVQINDTVLPEHIDELELKFSHWLKYQDVNLGYHYYDRATNKMLSSFYGYLTVDDAFNNLMIQIPETTNLGGKEWSGADGLTIAAPADTRDEALAICNHFLEETPSEPLE